MRTKIHIVRALLVALTSAFLGVALVASAAASRRLRVNLEYDAHAECPTEQHFVKQLRARSDKLEITSDPSTRRLRVEIRVAKKGSVGRLEVLEPGRAVHARQVSSAECDAVVRALALTAALSLDPEAALGPAPTPAPQVGPPEPLGGAPVPADRPASELAQGESRFMPSFGTGAVLTNPVVPGYLWGALAFAQAEWLRPSMLSPALRISGYYARGSRALDNGGAEFSWAALALDVSPLRLETDRFSVRPSASFFGGVLRGEGRNLDRTEAVSRSWWSIGGAARASYRVFGPLGVELTAALSVPLRHRAFVLENPLRTAAESPFVCALFGVALVSSLS